MPDNQLICLYCGGKLRPSTDPDKQWVSWRCEDCGVEIYPHGATFADCIDILKRER